MKMIKGMDKGLSSIHCFHKIAIYGVAFVLLAESLSIGVNAYSSTANDVVTNASTANDVPLASEIPPVVMHNYVDLIIANVTSENMLPEEKLYACYEYCIDLMDYKRDTNKADGSKIKDYALEAFFTGKGNCYRFASMFAYIADALGYDVKVQAGQCTSSSGGKTPHSWCVITDAYGNELVYDLSFGNSVKNHKQFYGIKASQHIRKLYPEEEWKVIW